jgi:hypothetical protein
VLQVGFGIRQAVIHYLRDQLISRSLNLPYRPFRMPGWAKLH